MGMARQFSNLWLPDAASSAGSLAGQDGVAIKADGHRAEKHGAVASEVALAEGIGHGGEDLSHTANGARNCANCGWSVSFGAVCHKDGDRVVPLR